MVCMQKSQLFTGFNQKNKKLTLNHLHVHPMAIEKRTCTKCVLESLGKAEKKLHICWINFSAIVHPYENIIP